MAHAIPHERLKRTLSRPKSAASQPGIQRRVQCDITCEKFQGRSGGPTMASSRHRRTRKRAVDFPGSENTGFRAHIFTSANAGQPVVNPAGQKTSSSSAQATWAMDVCCIACSSARPHVTAVEIQNRPAPAGTCNSTRGWARRSLPRQVLEYKEDVLYLQDGRAAARRCGRGRYWRDAATSWVPENFARVKGSWLAVDEDGHTRDPQFRCGRRVKAGLLTKRSAWDVLQRWLWHADVMGERFDCHASRPFRKID